MQEIAELIAERGPFMPDEILPELRAVTLRGVTLHKEPLTPGTLKKRWTCGCRSGATSSLAKSDATPAGPDDARGCSARVPSASCRSSPWPMGTKPYWQ